MSGICDGRVVIVTGAGRGIGRGHALEFARQGAKVVVNDVGAEVDGTGSSTGPAGEVVDEIRAAGGEAVANGDDVASWDGAERLVRTAVDAFGRLDVLVNNAGILRDRMLVNMTEDEWSAVLRVHLTGTFAPTHFAAGHWRERSRAGDEVDARVVNTSSTSGIFGNVGQTNYGAAKAGIAAFTVIAAQELARYGVTVNAVAPGARTRMTENLAARPQRQPPGTGAGTTAGPSGTGTSASSGGAPAAPGPDEPDGFDPRAPENVAPLVVWLGSPESRDVTGQVFLVTGGRIAVALGWRRGPSVDAGRRWDPAELGEVVPGLVADAADPAGTASPAPSASR